VGSSPASPTTNSALSQFSSTYLHLDPPFSPSTPGRKTWKTQKSVYKRFVSGRKEVGIVLACPPAYHWISGARSCGLRSTSGALDDRCYSARFERRFRPAFVAFRGTPLAHPPSHSPRDSHSECQDRLMPDQYPEFCHHRFIDATAFFSTNCSTCCYDLAATKAIQAVMATSSATNPCFRRTSVSRSAHTPASPPFGSGLRQSTNFHPKFGDV
jgi:hypothetical protein